jgi:hypothetical protein
MRTHRPCLSPKSSATARTTASYHLATPTRQSNVQFVTQTTNANTGAVAGARCECVPVAEKHSRRLVLLDSKSEYEPSRWAGIDLPNMRRHRLPSFALIPFLFFALSFANALYGARARGLPGTFLLSLLLSSPLFSFVFSFPSNAEQRYQLPQWCFLLQNITRFGPGARSPGVEAHYGSTIRRLIYHTVCWRGQQHEQESREWLFLGAHIYLAGFSFTCLEGGGDMLD